jgi:hypothetical protein
MDGEISIRAHYERFPATIKGAFVLRGEGRDPRQVRIEDARVIEVSGGGSQPLTMEPVTLEVAPHLDLFVPFEVPLTELGAGWYSLECDVVVDGVPDVVHPGDRFPVAWPRATVRRGPVTVGKTMDVGGGDKVSFDQIDCAGDSIRIGFAASAAPALKLTADGTAVPVLDTEFDEASGRGRIVGYPLLRTQGVLSIEAKGAKASLQVKLP